MLISFNSKYFSLEISYFDSLDNLKGKERKVAKWSCLKRKKNNKNTILWLILSVKLISRNQTGDIWLNQINQFIINQFITL